MDETIEEFNAMMSLSSDDSSSTTDWVYVKLVCSVCLQRLLVASVLSVNL